jgi:hypothetical protein
MIYLISYVPNLLYSPSDIHDFITNHLNPPVDWWYYSGVYLLNTSLSIPQITSSLRIRYPNLQHFVVKVNLDENGGLLPKEAWDWINKKIGIKPKLKTSPSASPLISTILRSQQPLKSNPASFSDLLKLINESKKK